MDSFNTDRKMSGMTREEEIDYLEKVKFARYDKLSEIMKEFRIHGFNATIRMGQTTIKSALLINAGAVIAFLTIFTNNIKYFFNMNAEYVMIGQGVLDAVHYWGNGDVDGLSGIWRFLFITEFLAGLPRESFFSIIRQLLENRSISAPWK